MATAHMLSLDKDSLADKAGMVDFVTRCQVPNPFFSCKHLPSKDPKKRKQEAVKKPEFSGYK